MDEANFRVSFVREYLRNLQNDKSIITGVFETEGHPIVWGAIAEYGDPPPEGLLIEIWSDEAGVGEENSAHFRFWHARESKGGSIMKGRVVLRDELVQRRANA